MSEPRTRRQLAQAALAIRKACEVSLGCSYRPSQRTIDDALITAAALEWAAGIETEDYPHVETLVDLCFIAGELI